jgi:hypothetical protein
VNYYGPRQLASDKTWHYTCRNGDHTWPVGYCVSHPGHATEAEACQCYKRFLLDTRLDLNVPLPADTQKRCARCQAWTSRAAMVDHSHHWDLCDTCRTKEVVAELMPTPSICISSY